MSSLEIAELTGKEHKNVLADTRKMFEELDVTPADFSAVYKDQQFIDRPCFKLNEELSLTLVSGYNLKIKFGTVEKVATVYNQKGQTVETYNLDKRQSMAESPQFGNIRKTRKSPSDGIGRPFDTPEFLGVYKDQQLIKNEI